MRPLLAWCAAQVYLAYYATLRVCCVLPDGSIVRPSRLPPLHAIYALSERDALAASGLMARRPFAVLVDTSRDGGWASAMLAALGCTVIRGSTRHGGAPALRALLRQLAMSEAAVGLVVDGPLGPAGIAKPGAVVCGAKSGRPVHAVGTACDWKLTFPRTWSGIYLPLPFSRVVIAAAACRDGDDRPCDLDAETRRVTERLETARGRAASTLRARAARMRFA